MADLTADRLRQLLAYDSTTGVFTRLVALDPGGSAGEVAGTLQKSTGYRRVCVDGTVYRENRLAWLYVYERWPVAHIDHRNGVRDDNRIDNLREATRTVNSQNRRRAQRNNLSSGLLGVTAKRDKWVASIRVDRRLRHLGTFATKEAAHQRYLQAKRALHIGCTL